MSRCWLSLTIMLMKRTYRRLSSDATRRHASRCCVGHGVYVWLWLCQWAGRVVQGAEQALPSSFPRSTHRRDLPQVGHHLSQLVPHAELLIKLVVAVGVLDVHIQLHKAACVRRQGQWRSGRGMGGHECTRGYPCAATRVGPRDAGAQGREGAAAHAHHTHTHTSTRIINKNEHVM